MLDSYIPILNIAERAQKPIEIDRSQGPSIGPDSQHHSVRYHFHHKKLCVDVLSRSKIFTRSIDIESFPSENNLTQVGRDRSTLGYLPNPWQGNRLFVGSAASNLGDLAIPTLQLVQSSILRLLDLFPNGVSMKACAQEFNTLSQQEFERVMEFHLAQLCAPILSDEPTTEQLGKVSKVLENKLSVYKASGVFPSYEGESVGPDIWVSLLLNSGVVPSHYDPVLDNYPISSVSTFLAQQARLIENTVKVMPAHDEYLSQYIVSSKSGADITAANQLSK